MIQTQSHSDAFRVEVSDHWLGRDGVGLFENEGVRLSLDGVEMVRLRHGTIVPAEGFHETKADAIRAAADRIEMIGRRLTEQAARMRSEAR